MIVRYQGLNQHMEVAKVIYHGERQVLNIYRRSDEPDCKIGGFNIAD